MAQIHHLLARTIYFTIASLKLYYSQKNIGIDQLWANLARYRYLCVRFECVQTKIDLVITASRDRIPPGICTHLRGPHILMAGTQTSAELGNNLQRLLHR